jgi:hypothetical protein
VSTLGGKKSVVIFCLDKDIDDLARRMRRSAHVIYTETFDVENYLFAHGDLIAASAAATTMDAETIGSIFNPIESWTKRVSQQWQDWVAVCVFEITEGCASEGNYRLCPSPIHCPDGAIDQDKFSRRISQMEATCALPSQEFQRRWLLTVMRVRRYFEAGRGDKLFKGKWYSWIAGRELSAGLSGRDAYLSDLGVRLPIHLFQVIDFGGSWASGLRGRFEMLLDSEFPPQGSQNA